MLLPARHPPSSIGLSSSTRLMEIKALLGISIAIGFISPEAGPLFIVLSRMTIALGASPIDTKKRTSILQLNISKTPPLSREREAILLELTQSNNKEATPRRANRNFSRPQIKQTLAQVTPPNRLVVKNRHRQ